MGRMNAIKQKLRQAVVVGIVLLAMAIMRDASDGFHELLKLRESHATMAGRVESVEENKQYWEREKRRIQQDPEYVKQLARDYFNMIEQDEEAFDLLLPDETSPEGRSAEPSLLFE